MELLVSSKLAHSNFYGIPWNCSCQRNWRTWSSMEFHGNARVSKIGALIVPWNSMEPLVSSKLAHSKFHGIPWNCWCPILMKIIFNCAGWINSRKLINTPYLFASLFHQVMFYYQYLHYTICISGITHYVSKYHSKALFNAHWNLFWSKSSLELSPEFHGTFWTTFEQHLWFHGIPWNLSNKTSSSMEFHGIPWSFVQIQSSMEFHWTFSILTSSMEFNGTFNFPQKSSIEFHGFFFWSSMEFHGIPWNLINFIFKRIIFLNIVFGIWLMIRCYLAKISQKRYILYWFQYR